MRYPTVVPALLALCLASTAPVAALAMTEVAPAPATAATPAKPATLAETLAELRKTIDARLADIEAGADVPHRFDWTALDGQFEDLSANLATLSAQDAKNRLRNLGNNLKSPEAKELVARLSTAVDAAKIEEERAKITALETRLADIAKAALAAAKPGDLDPVFNQLEEFESDLSQLPHNNRLQRLRNALNRQQNFLNQWQTLLENITEGNTNGINNAVGNLNNGYSRAFGVDRSAVRDRIAKLRETAQIPSAENDPLREATLDNLETVKARLAASNENHGWNVAANQRMQLIAALDMLQNATLALRAGDTDQALAHAQGFGGVQFGGAASSAHFAQLQRLRALWLAASLPALTGLDGFAPLGDDAAPATYLRRLHLAADSASDWPRAAAIARIQRGLRAPVGQTSPEDPHAPYLALFAGQRLEAAGQPAAAAEQYRAALVANPSPNLAQHLTTRLLALAPAATP